MFIRSNCGIFFLIYCTFPTKNGKLLGFINGKCYFYEVTFLKTNQRLWVQKLIYTCIKRYPPAKYSTVPQFLPIRSNDQNACPIHSITDKGEVEMVKSSQPKNFSCDKFCHLQGQVNRLWSFFELVSEKHSHLFNCSESVYGM